MQRYHGASCTSAVNSSGLGGISSRDTTRTDSSSLPTNFSINSRRSVQLIPYRLKCEKEPLNSRLGPPDFHPQTSNCPEETLTRDYVHSGYRETIEGVEDARELSLTQITVFTKPVVLKCKEAIRKRLRAINESRARKRKAGQVYGAPLSGSLLSRHGLFPEQRPFGEDSRKRWIEGLSQYQKSLQALADNVPHGYRKKSLFEVLIRNNVPLLRATWFIKVTYLNQIRSGPSSTSSETADKSQLSRTELWTKDVIDYLQYLLDEYLSRNSLHLLPQNKDQNRQMLYAGSAPHKSDSISNLLDGEEPSLHFKWWYVVRLVHCHCSEGLIIPSLLIDWVIQQLQEKDVIQVLQLVLPIIYSMLEMIVLSQTCVRNLVDVALRFLREPSSGGSDLVDNSRRAYTTSALAEMLRYLIMSVPDTFVALDCFPLPSSVVNYMVDGGNSLSKLSIDADGTKGSATITRKLDIKYQSLCFSHVVASIQKRAAWLAKASSTGCCGINGPKVVQSLNTSLHKGDLKAAYKFLFEDVVDTVVDECWISEVSPSLRSWLKWIDSVSFSFICAVFLLCEWCTCDYGDLRNGPIPDLKCTGGKDFSQIHVAVELLKLKMRDMHRQMRGKNGNSPALQSRGKGLGENDKFYRTNVKLVGISSIRPSELFESPSCFHDIIVCWIDQHEVQKGEGLKRVQVLLVELICSGIFYPPAYARQLIVSGVMDCSVSVVNVDRQRRHSQVLKQLPPAYVQDAIKESEILAEPELAEAIRVYGNERRLLLRGLLSNGVKNGNFGDALHQILKQYPVPQKNASSVSSVDQPKVSSISNLTSRKYSKNSFDIKELKAAISVLLQLPKTSASADSTVDESRLNFKKPSGLISNNMDTIEGTLGCEECHRAKRQKVSNDKSSHLQASAANFSDDEDSWWVKREQKSVEISKVDPPLKPAKQAARGRQKTVRKTQSLAHLATARIEGSQGASTSHVCENRTICPHHRINVDGEAPKSVDGIKASHCGDIVSIRNMLKQKRFMERRSIGNWLLTAVKQLVEESDRTVKSSQNNRSLSSVDERSSSRWKLGEDELSVILYLMDASSDLSAAVRFLVWLLPKAVGSNPTPAGRNMLLLAKNTESYGCEVGEPFLLSCIRRYENILVAADLIPQVLSAAMLRATTVIASNGRLSNSPIFFYARYLLKKYEDISTVAEWEKNFKATCDRKLTSELESGRLQNVESGFPLGVPSGVEDLDDFIRQKISGNRLSRAGMSMRETVQRFVDEMVHHLFGKERKLFAAGAQKSAGMEKWDGGSQIAQQIVIGLMDCIRQTGGAAQEGDPSLVSSAVSAIVSNVGPVVAKMPDFTVASNHSSLPSPTGSLNFARRIIGVHIKCLCLLKEALGERHSRTFEIALAAEASSALAGVLAPGKAARSQYQFSSDAQEPNANSSSDVSNNSVKIVIGRATKTAAAVSALVVGAVIHGVASLERMVRVFRLKEGLDVMKSVRSSRTNSNGSARSVAALRVDSSLEVYVHWFRLLVGNCRTVSDGLIVELLGEPSIVALSRMQRTLPLDVVLHPAYSMFAFMIWRPIIYSASMASREDNQQLFNSMVLAVGDAVKHMPFRDVCLRDTQGFYDLVTSDPTDSEFAAFIEMNGSERHLKGTFVPLRSRLFLNALVDCKLPYSVLSQDEGNRVASFSDSKMQYTERETKISEKLVHALDTLQLARFHWQWVELKLLLIEQELDSSHTKSIAEALRSLSPKTEKASTSEHENHFVECVLTRLLVRPDAASLLSEVVHLFGKLIENSMLVSVKWLLAGEDVLYGRKSIRQRLANVAERKGLSTKALFWKPWGWCCQDHDTNRGGKRKLEMASLEEGEVGEVGADFKRHGNGVTRVLGVDSFNHSQQLFAEKGLIDLVIPSLDRSSDESCNVFAGDLIKQMNYIEQQISGVNGGTIKQAGTSPSGTESSASKASNRKNMKAGSPGLSRRLAGPVDPLPSPPVALRASISLRLQLLLRLLPTICADGETNRSMRSGLATIILRLLGSRIIFEDVELSNPGYAILSKRDRETEKNGSNPVSDFSGRNVFDCLLLVLNALLSRSQACWLKVKHASKVTNESTKVSSGIDRETLENIQSELDRMQLPDMIRWRIKTAMPILALSNRTHVSCQPPSIPTSMVSSLQSNISNSNQPIPRNSSSALTRAAAKTKSSQPQPDLEMELDPWTLLEDGAGAGPSTATMGISDHSNVRAASWLKGTVRVRRSDLTYIGAMDDDS
ncbi:hypothetical protein V2J09_004506 [Rumex salicifolius]